MALHRAIVNEPTAREHEVLKIAYDGLRITEEQLQDVEREICRLMSAKMMWFPEQSSLSRDFHQKWDEGFGDGDLPPSEWWKWAAHNGLFESVDNLDRELEKANASKAKFEGVQSALRCCINNLSRPYLRNLNILDLPNEILLKVFEFVEDKFEFPLLLPFYRQGTKDIKNIRLVCWRFCNLSSQLLVRVVRVNFNELSLARLEEISRHPTISKGVRAVQIVLHFYNFSFTDFHRFISYQADEVENHVDPFDHAKMWESLDIPEQTALEMVSNGRAVISTLRRLELADPDDNSGYCEGDEDHRARLGEIHRQYLILLEKQESLIRTKKLSQTVGSAISRMLGLWKLDFNDTDFESLKDRRLMVPGGSIWDALHRYMLQPITGDDAKKHGLELPNYQCIVNVIDSVRRAGTLLDNIDIKLSTLGYPGSLALAPDIRREFSSRMQQLKEFAFSFEGNLTEQDADDLSKFLSAFLDTSSLQNLRLHMRGEEAEAARIDVGQIIGSKSRHKLIDISFDQVAMDLPRLLRFLERLPQSIHCIHLRDVRLLSGTWKEALDALRKKRSRVVLFSEPQGAECDNMPREVYESIFSTENCDVSNAERYIRNWIPWEPNPLQALEDGLYNAN
ncbi:hypothetical protein I7I51_03437 [Histoplasma capsulatum]|uniref:F-box domain-containing protein n=1 Tax=Ajellomyces capsulatus TaxID=5037 RepID=A0A8A1M9G7_AJECA|nr:predicted protein [Histoplasma mississippiense (nom. inval.)]EDN07297.1 predicted protein [Histoplasma mississippiense (nom. inval.)]QSS61264.1 hypothetical protein I7I51_03437 [Histoplasma capsulatum]